MLYSAAAYLQVEVDPRMPRTDSGRAEKLRLIHDLSCHATLRLALTLLDEKNLFDIDEARSVNYPLPQLLLFVQQTCFVVSIPFGVIEYSSRLGGE